MPGSDLLARHTGRNWALLERRVFFLTSVISLPTAVCRDCLLVLTFAYFNAIFYEKPEVRA
jgi:hypothetical protein